MTFATEDIAIIVLGAIAGGFVNGLTGFGTALIAQPIWLHALPPAIAGALAAAAGVVGQLQTIHLIRGSITWQRVGPFILAGLIGVPIGTLLLPLVSPRAFKVGVGLMLILYCSFHLTASRVRAGLVDTPGGRLADALVGFGGGVMGGFAGLSGPLPIIWSAFKPWTREEKRALFQSFNVVILSATLCSSAVAGLLPAEFWRALLIALPGTLLGVRLGTYVYRRLDDRRFDSLVMAILLLMGAWLIAANV